MWDSKGMEAHLHDMAEGVGAVKHAKKEAWSPQRAQGLGRLEAKRINWAQQGDFYEDVVYTVYFNLNPSSELAPRPFHRVDWKRVIWKAVT